MSKENVFADPIYFFLKFRSWVFAAQYLAFFRLARQFRRVKSNPDFVLGDGNPIFQKALDALLREDAKNIHQGIYPISVLRPESLKQHIKRFPALAIDSILALRRKNIGKVDEFSSSARE